MMRSDLSSLPQKKAAPPKRKEDFATSQDIRWCPGCGDYAVLAAVKRTCMQLNLHPSDMVFISGIGCSSRLPYYMNTYGFHTIHGRAPAIATGLKIAQPKRMVWVITGDGDALSIGTNHFVHTLRRNVNLTYLLINNRIYGLTKGQYSPTSTRGQRTGSTPTGSIESPLNPIALAAAAGASFIARCHDKDLELMERVFLAAAAHPGTGFVEVYQNCNIFNDKAFDRYTRRNLFHQNAILLEDQKPLLFGDNKSKGIRLNKKLHMDIVPITAKTDLSSLCRHDAGSTSNVMINLYSEMGMNNDLPMPFGIFRRLERSVYEDTLAAAASKSYDRRQALHAMLHASPKWRRPSHESQH